MSVRCQFRPGHLVAISRPGGILDPVSNRTNLSHRARTATRSHTMRTRNRRRPRVRLFLEDRRAPAAGLVAAYGFDEGAGTTTADASGNGNTGTVANTTWSTAGHSGNALSFNGTNSWVTVNDAPSLDLTTAMTLEAWVRPSTISGWRTALIKEMGGGEAYTLYASQGAVPSAYVNIGGDKGTDGTVGLPLNTWSHLAA